ncbi:MAG: putative zinc-binding peptidase [Chitinophagaceae bacterium]
MQLFECSHCGNAVYFDNVFCASCGCALGYNPLTEKMVSLVSNDEGTYSDPDVDDKYHYCSNHQYDVCNWIIPDDDPATVCIACSLNRTIPNISNPEYKARWKKIEAAKHRLVYALMKWHLPVVSKVSDEQNGLAFDFKSDDGQRVLTGHANGLITMNIEEADDVEREMAKNNMDEVYRTVLGHFRHEVGHYYWEQLIRDNPENLEDFRALFGDDRKDYQQALDEHYQNSAPTDWNLHYISSYATMHPWEDWAETWAHYLHIVDTLETAYSFGVQIKPMVAAKEEHLTTHLDFDPYLEDDFQKTFDNWLPVSFALNSINRSMGEGDLYPFVINEDVKKKLEFIHRVIRQ